MDDLVRLSPLFRDGDLERYNVVSVAAVRTDLHPRPDPRHLLDLARDVAALDGGSYRLRVHFDASVMLPVGSDWELTMRELSRDARVQLVHFDAPAFRDGRGGHSGTFGAMMRFVPLFDYPSNARIGTVVALDGEVGGVDWDVLTQFRRSPSRFHFKTKACYHAKAVVARAERDLPDRYKPSFWQRVVPSLFAAKGRVPRATFDDFLACLRDECPYLADNFNLHDESNPARARLQSESRLTGHGLDSFFANTGLLKHVDDSGEPYSYTVRADVGRGLLESRPRDDALAGKFYARVLGRRGKKRQRQAASHAVDSDPAAAARYVVALREARAAGQLEALGLAVAQAECAIRNGGMRGANFVLETRVTLPFAEMMRKSYPDLATRQLNAEERVVVDALMRRPAFDGGRTLSELMAVMAGDTDTLVLKGGVVRDMVQGAPDSRDVDLCTYPSSTFVVTRRLTKEFGDAVPMRAARTIPLVQLGRKDDPRGELDVSDGTVGNAFDAACNGLMVDPLTHTLYDPTGRGVRDAQRRVYHMPKGVLDRAGDQVVCLLWRHLKFALRGYTFDDAQTAALFARVLAVSSDGGPAEQQVWTRVPFASTLDRDTAQGAFRLLKDETERLREAGLLEFGGGDMLMALIDRGTLVARPVNCDRPKMDGDELGAQKKK